MGKICFIDALIEFKNSFKSIPRYQALNELSPKVIMSLNPDKFLSLYKKNSLSKSKFLEFLDFSLSERKSKKHCILKLFEKEKEILKSFDDEEKIQFFNILLNHNFASSKNFQDLFFEIGLNEFEDIDSIKLVDKFLSELMKKPRKIFETSLADFLIPFLMENIENNMDLLDDKLCLTLLEINQKLRLMNLILAEGSLETKYLLKIENRFIELLNLQNISEEPEFLSKVMYSFGKLNYAVQNENLVDYFESKLLINFKTLTAQQIYRTLLFLLAYNSKKGMNQKQFLDLFYIKYMYGTNFYLKEYLNRIMHIKKFEINFFKNLGMIFTRFFMSSHRIFEPRYIKTFHFDIFQLGELFNFFGKIESYNLSNIMIVLRKHIIQRLQIIYEYKLRKNINMEYKLHEFWMSIFEYFDFHLEKNEFILEEVESSLLYNMSLDYAILNWKTFQLEDMILLYEIIEKRKFKSKSYEAKKLGILESFLDEKCCDFIKDQLLQKYYVPHKPLVMVKALEQGMRLMKKEMMQVSIIGEIINEMLSHLKSYDDNIIVLKMIKIIEGISLQEGSLQLTQNLIEKIMKENVVETFLIKDFEILSTTLRLFLDFYCVRVQKYEKIFPGQFLGFLETLGHSINLLIRKLFFLDSEIFDENNLTTMLIILKVIEDQYLKYQHAIAKEIETLSKFSFRFIADRHNKFSYPGLEKLLNAAFQLNSSLNQFDDGSGLYDKTLLEELDPYIEDHWKKFSEDFRNEWNELKIKISSNP